MTERDTFTDDEPTSATPLNSMKTAIAGDGVLSGGDLSTGAGNFDVDVTAVEYVIGDSTFSATSDTIDHVGSGTGDRWDIIVADTNQNLTRIEGTEVETDGKPIAPTDSVTSTQVIAGQVYIRGGSTEILGGDLYPEYKTKLDWGVPSGLISMWSGAIADIPLGWSLCDGTDGTPDLQDRFVVGAGDSYSVDQTGGADEVQLTIGEMPSHSHDIGVNSTTGSNADNTPAEAGNADDSTRYDGMSTEGGNQAHENRPPFYALAYIMKI